MDRQDPRAAYIRAVQQEREDWLYQHALNKVRVITRSMKAEEKEAYLSSPAFANALAQVRRKDHVLQALLRGELPLAWQREELDRLMPLIRRENEAGREVNLSFLRSVQRTKVPPEKAHRALELLQGKEPERFLISERDRMTDLADKKTERYLKTGNLARLFAVQLSRAEFIVPRVMETAFHKGLSMNVVNLAFHPGSLSRMIQEELNHAFPELGSCRSVQDPETGETVGNMVRNRVDAARNQVFHALKKRYPPERLNRLLRDNPSLQHLQRQADAEFARERKIRSALLDAIPEHYRDLYPLARGMHRRFILHLGPTNSGKTYEGVERLRLAQRGIYLGPLRLLAAEQFETLNLDDVPCSLVTGEEQIRVPGSRVQSSTVEMADLNMHYDIAVIDECQMISDRDRGGAWTAAILGLCADEIHACASPDAEALLTRIIRECGDELSIVRHERMTPLEVEKEGFQFPNSVRPGDALIVFSKARVHAVAAELRSRGYRVSLIYGALPPDVRRNQAERFHQGETEVVVSTDAIAMGMNLPIQRVVFLESEKYDGDITRTLTDAEIKQIAGRAGRYGIYEIGYVNAFGFKSLISQGLARPLIPLSEAVIRFPESLLGLPLPLTEIINQWLNMQDKECFSKASAVRMAYLAALMETRHTDKTLLYRFLCIPFDEAEPDLLYRWKTMYQAEARGEHIDVMPEMPAIRNPEECTIQMLDSLEAEYRRCDLYYNYTRLFLENPDRLLDEIQRRKDLISQGIVHILSTQRLQQKTCGSCKRQLPWNWPYRFCDSCYRKQHAFRGKRRFRMDLNDPESWDAE